MTLEYHDQTDATGIIWNASRFIRGHEQSCPNDLDSHSQCAQRMDAWFAYDQSTSMTVPLSFTFCTEFYYVLFLVYHIAYSKEPLQQRETHCDDP